MITSSFETNFHGISKFGVGGGFFVFTVVLSQITEYINVIKDLCCQSIVDSSAELKEIQAMPLRSVVSIY